jgi:hypothetical protein
MEGECVKYMRCSIDALGAECAVFEFKQEFTDMPECEPLQILRPQIPRPHTFTKMQHFALNFPRRSDKDCIDTYIRSTNLVPHLHQIFELHLQSRILECYDPEPHSSLPWPLLYGMWWVLSPGRRMARLQNGDKIGARQVVIKLDYALTARGTRLVESSAERVDLGVVSRM